MTSGTGPATSSGSAVTLATPDLKPSSLPFLTCATGPYRATTLFANDPWVPKSSQGYWPRRPAPQKIRAALSLACSIAQRVVERHVLWLDQPPAIFCLRTSIALSTAVASSAGTSGTMPTLLYFVPVTAPTYSCDTTASRPPSG